MGKYFDKYKIYYDNLSVSRTMEAQKLSQYCSEYLESIKNNFKMLTGTNWEERGKISAFSIFEQLINDINNLATFVKENLFVDCQKADELYIKVVKIKDNEEALEAKVNSLSECENDLVWLNSELAREKSKKPTDIIDKLNIRVNSLQRQIKNAQNVINALNSEIENLIDILDKLTIETDQLIEEMLLLDGGSFEVASNVGVDLESDAYSFEHFIQGFNYFDKHLFLGAPYTKWERYGNGFLVTLSNGQTFTVYQQTDANNYNTRNWHNHLRNNIGLNFNGNNPLGGGCSGFALASSLSYHLNLPHLDPGVGFSGGGMWGGIQSVLKGNEVLELVDPETGRLNHYTVKSNFKLGDYTGERFGLSTSDEFKTDVHKAFEQGGTVILNTTASGFASPDGQHFVTLIGEDENGYVIMADSMYEGRGSYSLNSSNYNPELPYDVNNCPPYMKYNKTTGEPFKTDDLVDYLIANSEGTNSYCAITSANLEFVEEAKIGEKYRSQYEEIVDGYKKES